MSDPKSNRGYVDTNYLAIAGEWFSEIKELTYDLMKITYGHHVLDVGCGPASDTLAIAEIVSPKGKVVGIDYDKDMVQVANEKAEEAGVSDYVTHQVANAEDMPFDDNSFHSARSERVLQHTHNPEKIIQEMVRVTKPGGWVVNVDSDWSMNTLDIPHDEMEWKLRRFMAMDTNVGIVGRQLYRLSKQAGLTDIHVQPMPLPIMQFEFWKIITSYEDKVIPRALKRGDITQQEVDDLNNLLEERDRNKEFFAVITLMIVAGKKPE